VVPRLKPASARKDYGDLGEMDSPPVISCSYELHPMPLGLLKTLALSVSIMERTLLSLLFNLERVELGVL
jgi:hypothetical protein